MVATGEFLLRLQTSVIYYIPIITYAFLVIYALQYIIVILAIAIPNLEFSPSHYLHLISAL